MLLRRRNEPDLRLSRADRDAHRAEAFSGLGRALRNLAVHNRPALIDALTDAYPWVEFLPSPDQAAFVEDFSRVVTAAAAVDNYEPLSQLVFEWRATAEVHADPELSRRLRRPLDAGATKSLLRSAEVAKRRERIAPPPTKGGWDFRYGTSDAAKGWDNVCASAPGNARVAWERITTDPRTRTDRQHPLRGRLALRTVNGVNKAVWLTEAMPGHPKATE